MVPLKAERLVCLVRLYEARNTACDPICAGAAGAGERAGDNMVAVPFVR